MSCPQRTPCLSKAGYGKYLYTIFVLLFTLDPPWGFLTRWKGNMDYNLRSYYKRETTEIVTSASFMNLHPYKDGQKQIFLICPFCVL